MAQTLLRKYLPYVLLVLLAIALVWYFQLEDNHALKSKIKGFIRAIT
jgi:hypothetical protein